MSDRGELVRSGARLVATVVLLFAVTGICRTLPVNTTTVGFAFLVTVLAVASTWGLRAAIVASFGGLLLYNFFFLPPFGTFTIADPQNWVALFSFLATAIVASQLSARARRQTDAALRRQHDLERLHALGRDILLERGDGPLPRRLAQSVAETFSVPAVVLYDAATDREYKGGPEDLTIPPDIRSAALSGEIGARADALDCRFSLIRLGGRPAGVLGMRGPIGDTAVDAIANLVAVGLERARAQEAETRAQAARESEELKSTVLDAIAHEFKTPLTAIKAAITSVVSDPAIPAPQRELLCIVDEETDRLNGLVSDAIEMSRVEGGDFQLRVEPVAAGRLLANVVRHMGSRLRGRTVEIAPVAVEDVVHVDSGLIELALRQLLDNAVKYSPAAGSIRVGAGPRADRYVFWVSDEGPGIAPSDAARLFDRFYRGSPRRHGVPGSGLGLAVVRQIAQAHHGDAVLANGHSGGARFEILVPVVAEGSAP